MELMNWIIDRLRSNISEAQGYIMKAYAKRETNATAAAWCRDMAVGHLAFNSNGIALAKKLMEDLRTSPDRKEYNEGMLAVYGVEIADINKCMAEVNNLISAYK
nr:MAG TPA: hypothetical protein [Caudoviricetes sp.]